MASVTPIRPPISGYEKFEQWDPDGYRAFRRGDFPLREALVIAMLYDLPELSHLTALVRRDDIRVRTKAFAVGQNIRNP